MNPFDQAWVLLLKEMLPPNYTQIGNEEKDLNAAERAWQMQYAKPNPVTAPQVDVSRPPVVNLGKNFFGPHSHERLTDRDRVVDEREQQEVRDRITMAMGQFLDEYGLYKPGAPRNLAIRTHLLNEHRRPDETYSKSNGDSIVAVVRPDRKNNMKPELNTVMLRRSEMHHEAPQPFKAAAMSVDKVVNAHGMSKKQMKRLAAMRRQNRAIRTGEPMDIAMQLLKGEERPHALMSNNDLFERINEILHYQSTDDNDDEYEELMQEAFTRRQENIPEPSFGALSEPPITFDEDFQDAHKGEPMDITFQLLKERKSPEAMRRKLEYDKRYEKTPERRKYQRELHAERRKRGIYGSGDHMDVSHTRGGKLTLEPEHSNRARHFKNRGTLRRVKVR
tara:strand:- start:616 stop:1788 length:1173 start_codon:yes stop_codon:yes gene_type:complete